MVGTSLKVLGVRRLVKELCCATRRRGSKLSGLTDNPPSALRFDFNAIIRRDYNNIASILLE